MELVYLTNELTRVELVDLERENQDLADTLSEDLLQLFWRISFLLGGGRGSVGELF